MKAQPLALTVSGFEPCEPEKATHLKFHMPGPSGVLTLPVMIGGTRAGTNNWTWNGSVDSPTLKPSILTRGRNEDGDWRCHTWMNDGAAQFLDDSTHELKGQTVPLLDLPHGVK